MSAAPATYDTTAAAALALTNASTAFGMAYSAQQADGAKSKTLTAAKNSAGLALLNPIRPIYGAISASATLSDAQKVALGITIRRMPAPQPAPSTQPVVSFTGAAPPASVGQWKFEGNAGKTVMDVTFYDAVAPGTLVRVMAKRSPRWWPATPGRIGPVLPS